MNLLTEQQLADKLGISKRRVQQWAAAGRIKPVMELPNGVRFYRPSTKRPKKLKGGRPDGKRNKLGRFVKP